MIWAPPKARERAASGKKWSKQTSIPRRTSTPPAWTVNTGKPVRPPAKCSFSSPKRWVLRYTPSTPSGPISAALL